MRKEKVAGWSMASSFVNSQFGTKSAARDFCISLMVLAASNSMPPIPPMLPLRIFNEVTDAIKQLKKVIGDLQSEMRKIER